MNVSGHRLSTTEIESALVSHPKVAEAAVVGATDDTTGQAVCAFVILRGDAVQEADEPGEGGDLVTELRNHVAKEIGPIAKPRQIMVVAELPKTRSGKIMRRLLRDVAENREVGDVTTLADSSVMDLIKSGLSARTEPEDRMHLGRRRQVGGRGSWSDPSKNDFTSKPHFFRYARSTGTASSPWTCSMTYADRRLRLRSTTVRATRALRTHCVSPRAATR